VRGRDLERLAREIRERAGLLDDDFADAVAITACIVGPMSIVYDVRTPGTFLRPRGDGRFEIVMPPGAPDLRFRLLHETAHVVIAEKQLRLPLEEEERAANYIAAAVMAPPERLRRAHRYFGEKLKPIARTFGMSQTATQLRLGEVLEDERAIVTRSGFVMLRTQGTFPWADVPVVDVARGGRWRGLAKAQLRGGIDEGRVAVRAK
jgi:hypothetical protein